MNSYTTAQFWRLYRRLPDRVKDQAQTAYRHFAANPDHPGLRFKPVKDGGLLYSARVTLGYRVLGVRSGNEIIWFFIGNHDDYLREIAKF